MRHMHIDPPKEEKKDAPLDDKMALIVVHYGGDNHLRKKAIMSAIYDWDAQLEKPDEAIFLELVCPGETQCFKQELLPKWLRYICLYGKERNKSLFQKEAMWNMATRFTTASKLLFLDSDVSPIDTLHYFRDMKAAICRGKVIHACYKLIQEKYEDQYLGEMYSILAKKEKPEGHYLFPGIGYGITREDFHRRDGFQPFSIPGSGDVIFCWETFPDIKLPMGSARRFHQSLIRRCPKLDHDALDVTMQHNFHGNKEDRAYVFSREAVLLFGLPQAYCHIDQSGLLAWTDPHFILKDIVMKKEKMHTVEELYNLVCSVVKARLQKQVKDQAKGEGLFDPTDFNKNE